MSMIQAKNAPTDTHRVHKLHGFPIKLARPATKRTPQRCIRAGSQFSFLCHKMFHHNDLRRYYSLADRATTVTFARIRWWIVHW